MFGNQITDKLYLEFGDNKKDISLKAFKIYKGSNSPYNSGCNLKCTM